MESHHGLGEETPPAGVGAVERPRPGALEGQSMRDRRSFSALVGGGLLLALFWPATSSTPAPPLYGPPEAGSEGRAVLAELALLTHGNDGGFALFAERPLAALAH